MRIRKFYDAAPGGSEGGGATDTQFAETVNKALKGLSESAQKNFKDLNDKIQAMNTDGATKAEFSELKAAIQKNSDDFKAVNDFAQNLQKELKGKASITDTAAPSFTSEIGALIEKNHAAIKAGLGKNVPITLEMENASITRKDMSFTGNTSGMVVAPDFNPAILGQPFQTPHLRTLVRIGQTSGQAYYYPVATKKSGNVESVQPGGTKPEIQWQIDGKVAQVIKLAAHTRLPDEMLEDILGLTSYLQNYMPEEVYKTEDQQILRGDGSTGHFNGLMNQASVHVPSAGVSITEPWDLLANGIAQQQKKWLPGNAILIDPIEWMIMATRKSTEGVYSHPTLIFGAPLSIAGLRILPHPLMDTNEYLIGNFDLAELKLRTGLSLRFFDQDRDNAIKNMTTIVVEERAAFAVYYPEAFLKGTFGT